MPVNPAAVAHGPMLIGVTINVLVMGIIIMQTYMYFSSYRHRDQRWLKSLVAFILFANFLNTGFAVADLYLALINNFGNFQYLTVSTWLFVTDPVIVGTVASSVQMFFAWRVHALTGKWYLGLLTALLALAQLICAMLMAWKCHEFPAWADFAKFTDVLSLHYGSKTVVPNSSSLDDKHYPGGRYDHNHSRLVSCTSLPEDPTQVLIAVQRGHKTGLQGTDQVVDRIIRRKFTVSTGMLTSIWALLDLVLFLTMPDASHLIFQIPMVKLYTASLLSSLNSRVTKSKVHLETTDGGAQTMARFANQGMRKDNTTFRLDTASRPEVFVQVERHEMGDLPGDQKTMATSSADHDLKSGWSDAASHAV
ncbi:hypothetical protein DFH06DRAFT_1322859 [Mycena polygramma]|nr:hypothetical protein DFH06DRAFT_1322859 [Mycena polygramma]